jgi:hypothetical protein
MPFDWLQWQAFSTTFATGLPDGVCFRTKNPNLGNFWRVLHVKMLVYFMTIWSTFWRFVISYGNSVYFMEICCIISRFGKLYREKSGNSASLPSDNRNPFFLHVSFLIGRLRGRVARFVLAQNTKTGKIYQLTIIYTKWP